MTNRLTGTFREAVQVAYDNMGGHEAFTAWAKKNPTEFYRISARLIPIELRDTTDTTINVIIQRDGARPATVIDGQRALPDDSAMPDDSTDHG